MATRFIIVLFLGHLLISGKSSKDFVVGKQPFDSKNKKIDLRISFPFRNKPEIQNSNLPFYVRVVLENNTDTIASFYEDWNMWGYFNLRFQVRSTNGIDTLYKKMRDWPKNFPSYRALFPGDSLVMYFHLQDSKYGATPFEGRAQLNANSLLGIKAIYQLDSLIHAEDEPYGYKIKYRYKWKEEPLVRTEQTIVWGPNNRPIIVDSLLVPILAKPTFVLKKIESEEYHF